MPGIVSNWISKYKVCRVESVKEIEVTTDAKNNNGGSSSLSSKVKVCTVNVGTENTLELITVFSTARNVGRGSRLVVAPNGTSILGLTGSGDVEIVTKTTIGTYQSSGVFCNHRQMGWKITDTSEIGMAVEVAQADALIGEQPPMYKPKPNQGPLPESPGYVEGLFQKKLTKDEKKKLKEEKRKTRKATKEAKQKKKEKTQLQQSTTTTGTTHHNILVVADAVASTGATVSYKDTGKDADDEEREQATARTVRA